MTERRWFRVLALLLALAGTTYVLASLFLPSSRRLIFGVDKRSGRVRTVGAHVTFLPPHQYYRLSFERRDGWAQRDGFIRIESREKIPVTIDYRLRFGIAGDRLPDSATLVREGWSAWIGRRVAEAVDAVTQHMPIEELLAPTSRFNTERDPLRRTVAAYLARSGLKVTAFEIARIEADREALLRMKRAELRRAARGASGRVVIFAIDGADWELISELSIDGRIPNIRALARGGTTASMQTIQPTVSPMLWTTVATGLPPDRHGVIDFFDRHRRAPVDAYSRRAPALWDIAASFGRNAMAVNWWTAWPPTSAETFTFDAPVDTNPEAVHPAKHAAKVRELVVPESSVGYEQMRRFMTITPAEFEQATRTGTPRDPIRLFRSVLAKTWTDHRVAIHHYAQEQPLVMMLSYSGTDTVNHLFAPYHPPMREGVDAGGYRKYWSTVANYYSEIDRLIGEWMNVLPADTTVILLSAHGFKWGSSRPRAVPRGAALSDHRNPGIFIAYGNHVAQGGGNRSLQLYDVVPTVLAILGLPQSVDMPGQVAGWAFRDLTPVQSVRVVSYTEFMSLRPIPGVKGIDPKEFAAFQQAIGHITDPSGQLPPQREDHVEAAEQPTPIAPEAWGAYAFHNNQGVELRRQGKLDEAIEAFGRAVQLNPNRPTPHLNLAMALLERQQYTAAEEQFLRAVEGGLPNAERWFVDFAAWYRERNMVTRAIGLLHRGRALYPQSYLIAANLGSALVAMNRITDGLPELERALGLQPSSTLALNNLGALYAKRKDYGRALDFWNRSLAIDPRQPSVRAAAEAARSQL